MIQLTLQVRSYCETPPADSARRVFNSYPIIIGRSHACDYILQDVSKYISSNHALISQSDGNLMIKDTSANGLYINGSTEAVGRGNIAPLHHGDTITLGDYCLSISIQQGGSAASDDPFDDFYPESSAAEAATSVNRYHDAPGMDYDWRPPSQAGDDSSEWDATIQETADDKQHSSDDADWANWEEDEKPAANPRPPSRPRPNDSPAPPPFPGSRGTINTDDTLRAFLRAAGLPDGQLGSADDTQLMQQAGTLINQAVAGIMMLLKSRSELKNAIRSDVTTLARSDNNPLKFSLSAEEALEKLLIKQNNKGYLDAEQAMQQAVEDLQLHQLAMLEGMKAAVTSLLTQFDPDKLESRLEKTNPIAANIPLTREAKLWGLFEEKFTGIKEEALSDFNELFGREFKKAYEKRIRAQGRTPDF